MTTSRMASVGRHCAGPSPQMSMRKCHLACALMLRTTTFPLTMRNRPKARSRGLTSMRGHVRDLDSYGVRCEPTVQLGVGADRALAVAFDDESAGDEARSRRLKAWVVISVLHGIRESM